MHLQDVLQLELVGADQAFKMLSSVFLVLAEFIFTLFSIYVVQTEWTPLCYFAPEHFATFGTYRETLKVVLIWKPTYSEGCGSPAGSQEGGKR